MLKRQIFQLVTNQQSGNYAFELPEIDLSRDTAVYIRQSGRIADKKYGESRKMQLALKEFAMKLRKQNTMDHIRIYDEGAGKSGRRRIDERPKLNELWQDMHSGIIGTVIVALESRLFRDEHGDQSGAFSRLAQTLGIFLFVPAFTVDGTLDEYAAVTYYDFSNSEHLKEWKRKMDIASEYLSGHVKYMQAAKYAKTRRGAYDGRSLPPGLVVERYAPKDTRRPILYKPWADVMEWVFIKGEELGWNASAMTRYIENFPYLFPEPSSDDLARYSFCTNLTHCEGGGYKPKHHGTFLDWWTNVQLIGWWKVKSKQQQITEVLIENHPVVVSLNLFRPAYEAITGHTLEGEVASHTAPRRGGQVRSKIPEKEALLHGKLQSTQAKGVTTQQAEGHVRYVAYNRGIASLPVLTYSIYAEALDPLVVSRLGELVRADAGIAARFREHCERLLLQHAVNTVSIEDTVAEIDRKVAALRRRVTVLSMEVGGTEDGDKVIVDLVKSINGLLKEKATLLQKKDQTALVRGPEEVEEFFNLLSNFEEQWNRKPLMKRKRLIDICIRSITLDVITPHWMNLEISWLSAIIPRGDHALLWRAKGSANKPLTEEEKATLREAWPIATTYSEILKRLPSRSIIALQEYATLGQIHRQPGIQAKADVPDTACWADVAIDSDETVALALIKAGIDVCRKEKKGAHAFWTTPASADAVARLAWLNEDEGSSVYLVGMDSIIT